MGALLDAAQEPSVGEERHSCLSNLPWWSLLLLPRSIPFLSRDTYDTCSHFCTAWTHKATIFHSFLTSDFTSAGEAGENLSLKVSKPEYSMALVWSQSRWQRHDGLLWFLRKWSGTIIMPPVIYCSSPSEAASVFTLIWWRWTDEGEVRVEFGTEVCLMSQKQLHSRRHACCTLHDWNLFIPTEKNLPVCWAGFDCMKAAVWLHDRHLATHHFPLRSCLRPSDVNFCDEEPWK